MARESGINRLSRDRLCATRHQSQVVDQTDAVGIRLEAFRFRDVLHGRVGGIVRRELGFALLSAQHGKLLDSSTGHTFALPVCLEFDLFHVSRNRLHGTGVFTVKTDIVPKNSLDESDVIRSNHIDVVCPAHIGQYRVEPVNNCISESLQRQVT